MIRTATWILRQRPIRRRISWREIWAIVMTTCVMPSSRTRRGRSSVVPRTRIPWMTAFLFPGSSSTNPLTSRFMSPRPTISRAASTPARPAPTRRVGTLCAVGRERRPLQALRHLVEIAAQHPQPENPPERQDGPHEDDREGNSPAAKTLGKRQADGGERQGRPQGRIHEGLDLPQPDVAPDETVDPRQRQGGELDEDDVGQLLEGRFQLLFGHGELETQQVRERKGRDERRDVQRELDAPGQSGGIGRRLLHGDRLPPGRRRAA